MPPEENLKKPEQVPEEVPKQETAQNHSFLKSLRTYQGDIQETLANTKGSITSIFTAEQSKKAGMDTPQQINGTETRNKIFVLIGSLLLILGITTVVSIYYFKSTETVATANQNKAIIGFTEEKIMPTANSTQSELLSNILKEKQAFKLPVNSVLYLNTADEKGSPLNIKSLIELLFSRIPAELGRTLDPKYMLGIYSFDTNEPFIILTESDFGISYSGMLKWEETMVSDFASLFAIPSGINITTFEDEALKNKDLRVVKDANRKTFLLYSFLDKNTILITTNEKIFSAILGKYNTSRISR